MTKTERGCFHLFWPFRRSVFKADSHSYGAAASDSRGGMTQMLLTALSLGPIALGIATVVWLVERLPVIGVRWIEFLERRHTYAEKKRKRRKKKSRSGRKS